jgi:alpha-glucosidase
MPAWWESAVIYQIYPRSFQDSDGDGIGDLEGIRSRLPYLEWLGVDGIWLSPIYPSPLADYGYDVTDHASIAPEYGGFAEFDRLLEEAHARGLRLLLDLVPSHTSIEHPWFREHPERYFWAPEDGPEQPNNWRASFGGPAWSRDPVSGRTYLHSFFPEQPDLDWRRPDVREAMSSMIRGWRERGVDGFRVDAIDRVMKDEALRDDPPASEPFPLPVAPEQQMLELIHSRDAPDIGEALAAIREGAGELPLIGEVYLPVARMARYLDHLDRAFAFDLLHAPWEAEAIAGVLERSANDPGLAWVISNHDFSRVASRWGPAAVRNAALLLLTLPGPAFVYAGEELGMGDAPGAPRDSAPDRFGRDDFRHPPLWDEAAPGGGFSTGAAWLDAGDTLGTAGAAAQRDDPGSVLSLYRRLIALRRELAGPVAEVEEREGLVSFRRGEGHRIALNTGPAPAPMPPGEPLLLTAAGAIAAGGDLSPGAGALLRI